MDKLLVRHSPLWLSSCLLRRSSRPLSLPPKKRKQNRSLLAPRSPSALPSSAAPPSILAPAPLRPFHPPRRPLPSSRPAPRSTFGSSAPRSNPRRRAPLILLVAPLAYPPHRPLSDPPPRRRGPPHLQRHLPDPPPRRRGPTHPQRRPAPRSSSWAAHQPTFARTRILLGTCVEPSRPASSTEPFYTATRSNRTTTTL